MRGLLVSPAADEDVFLIWTHLFRRGGAAVANRVETQIYSAFDLLAARPKMGHRRPDLTKVPVLFFAVYEYLIVYRESLDVEIVRVLHGRRNVKRILRQAGIK